MAVEDQILVGIVLNLMGSIGKTELGLGAWPLSWGLGLLGEIGGTAMHTRVVIFAAFFVVFTLGLSSYLVFQHLSTYNEPSVSWLSFHSSGACLRQGLR